MPPNESYSTSTRSMRMGLNVKPDRRYFPRETVQNVNNLFSAIQGATCRFVPELTDDKMDMMLDAVGFPLYGSVSCNDIQQGIDMAYEAVKMSIPPEQMQILQPIGQEAHRLVTSLVRSDCDASGRISRSTLKTSTKVRINALCNI